MWAAASATRCRSIPGTSARSPARCSPAAPSSGSRTAPRTSCRPASRATTRCAGASRRRVRGAFTNKAPGGVAYSCSFRIAEAVYLVERTVDCLARELEVDPVQLRLKNLVRPDQFPYESRTGWVYDSGDYERTLRKALEIARYD